MTDARKYSARILDGYMNILEAVSGGHTADAGRQVGMQAEVETEKLGRETNKGLSTGQLDLKRGTSHKQEEPRDKLFVELHDKLANSMETQDYQRLLDRQIRVIKEFAGGEELITYMDPLDMDKLQRIAIYHGATIKVSECFSNGGTRAVFLGEYILMDNLS